jgi:hypothetical protein
MFSSGKFKPNQHGEYFFDRDPLYFPFILKYLRGYKIDLNKVDVVEFVLELEFYEIVIDEVDWEFFCKVRDYKSSIISNRNRMLDVHEERLLKMRQENERILREKEEKETILQLMKEKERVSLLFREAKLNLNLSSRSNILDAYKQGTIKFGLKSAVLHDSNLISLMLMLPDPSKYFKLIHGMSNGLTAQQFDASVKGKSPTLIIIESSTNYVFGAYVLDPWGSGNGWIKGNTGNFLFTFGNNNTPVKLCHNGTSNQGIYIFSSSGCHLGGGDLTIFPSNSCAMPTTYTIFEKGFEGTLSDSLLAGSSSFTIANCEVFHQIN